MFIPKIIHQTWKTGAVPAEWEAFQASWQRLHPDWEYKLWTDADNRHFIETHYPDFIPTFDAYTYGIQRADSIRYFLLHHFGGVYADLDLECLRPMDAGLLDRPFVTVWEPTIHAIRAETPFIMGNAFMASIPGSLPLVRIIETLKSRPAQILQHHEVLSSTGPKMVTEALTGMDDGQVRILDAAVFYPYAAQSPEMEMLAGGMESHRLKMDCLQKGAYGIHYWHNTWVRNLAGVLDNPAPHGVKGYLFYPGLDSVGFDMKNVGRKIDTLAAACTADPRAVGFNTDGFIKFRLRPKPRWSAIENGDGNQGLYIKKTWPVRTGLWLRSLLHCIRHRRNPLCP